MEKKYVERRLADVYMSKLEGSLDRTIRYLEQQGQKFRDKGWRYLRLVITPNIAPCGYYFELRGKRLETDSEFNRRKKKEQKRSEKVKTA